MAGPSPEPGSRVVLYDDDHYYIGGVLAEKLQVAGCHVTLVTPSSDVSSWTHQTMEQARIQTRLLNLGVDIVTTHSLAAASDGELELACCYTDQRRTIQCDALTIVTARISDESLFLSLQGEDGSHPGLSTLRRIGDCLVPSTIAQAVWDGHRAAREFQSSEPIGDEAVVRQEYVRVEGRRQAAETSLG